MPEATKNKLPPLSERMRIAADMITKGNTVADVGCDHGYISVYLCMKDIAPYCVASDINKGPLDAAKRNAKLFSVEDRVETRLSNGLEKYKPGEVKSILITGMGGNLIAKILNDWKEVTLSAEELILEPQSEHYTVRRVLSELGFDIVDEAMVVECGKYYPVIKAVRRRGKSLAETELIYGPCLIKNKDPMLKRYLDKEKKRLTAIRESLNGNKSRTSAGRYDEIEKELINIKEAEELMK